jgi:hypothetical protein
MKKWSFLFFTLLFFVGCSSINTGPSRFISSEKTIDVVFDIDWTIVSDYEPEFSKAPASKIFEADTGSYVLRDGVTELIEYLLSENIRVSFFSGGVEKRNNELLSKILLSDGRSLLDIAYKVKSKPDLTTVPDIPETAKFSEKFKKDLTKINPDLQSIILLDDNYRFYASPEQKPNLIFFGPTYKYFDEYGDCKQYTGQYKPQSFEQWNVDRKKMYIIKNHIERSLKEMREKRISFLKAIKSIEEKMDYPSGVTNFYTSEVIKKVTSPKKAEISDSNQCSYLFFPFMFLK